MAIAGLSLDLGGTSGFYAESGSGYTNTIAAQDFLILVPRVHNLATNENVFTLYASGSDYLNLNHSPTAFPLYVQWRGGASNADIIATGSAPNETYEYGAGQLGIAVWRSGTAFKLGMLDFGGESVTNDPAFVIQTSGTSLGVGHTWTNLKAGKVQLQRFNTGQNGKACYGPIIVIVFTAGFSWTDAQVEAAIMDPSSIPALCAANGGTIVHQWDGLTRAGASIKPSATGFRTAIATGDKIVDSVGGVDMTITAGTGTGYVYPDFTPVGRFVTGAGKLHNINESIGPLSVADAAGGDWTTRQTTDANALGVRYLGHIDANGAEDRIPIPLPGKVAHCTDGSGTLTAQTGDITPTADADPAFAGILPEYHHGQSISFDGTNLIIVPVKHGLALPSGATPRAPVVADKTYIQQAEYIVAAITAVGDVDALTPSLSLLTRTLAGSGNVTLDYQRIGATYAISARVGNIVVTACRCAGGDNGELIIRKFVAGVETCIRVTNNDLSGSGPWPVAMVPLGSNSVAILFVLRNASGVLGNGSGVRCLICADVATFTIGSFRNLAGAALSAALVHSTMQTGPDTTGTDISGFGATAADQGNGSAIGDGAGLIATVWAHGVGCNSGYSAAATRYKVNLRRISASDSATSINTTLDLTDLFEANVPGFRSASGKGLWSVPRLRWLNSAKTRIGVFLTDPAAATMTEQGTGAGGCHFDDTCGTRVLCAVLTNLSTIPRATWYGVAHTVSGEILSVDLPAFTPDSEYRPYLMAQGYMGPTSANSGLGQCRNVPISLAAVDTFAQTQENQESAARMFRSRARYARAR